MAIKPIPEGYRTVTPYLVIKGASAAIDYYKKVFGATERMRMDAPGGTIGHAELYDRRLDDHAGRRMGTLEDPFGHVWTIGTHVEDVSPEEMRRRSEEMMKQQA